MATVVVATPHGGLVQPEYYRSVLEVQHHTLQHMFNFVEVDTMIVSRARNALVEATKAQLAGADVIWFVDDDTLVPPHAGQLVDDAITLGVVSGVYFNRRPPYLPQVYRIAMEPEFSGMYWPVMEYPPGGLDIRDAVGGGCLAVRMDIFDKLVEYWKPRFEAAGALLREAYPEVAMIVERLSPWFEFLERKGEDLYFSERLAGIGQPIYVNWDIKCQHLSLVPIVEEHFKQLAATVNLQPIAGAGLEVNPGVVQVDVAPEAAPIASEEAVVDQEVNDA